MIKYNSYLYICNIYVMTNKEMIILCFRNAFNWGGIDFGIFVIIYFTNNFKF